MYGEEEIAKHDTKLVLVDDFNKPGSPILYEAHTSLATFRCKNDVSDEHGIRDKNGPD